MEAVDADIIRTRRSVGHPHDTEEGHAMYDDRKKTYRKARSIGLFLEVNQLPLIKKAMTARDTWSALKAYHEKATILKRVLLLKKMCRMELGESGNLDKHLMEIDLFDQLGDAGRDLDELFKVTMDFS